MSWEDLVMRLLAAIALLVSSATVSLAADECKDVLINKVMDLKEVKITREITLAMLASLSTSSSDDQNIDTAAKFPIEGIPFEGQGSWARSQKSLLERSIDLTTTLNESGSLLMMSGQAAIITAWSECMRARGGGIGIYFTAAGDGANQVYLNIEYTKAASITVKQFPLELTSDVYLGEPGEVRAVGNQDCLQKGFVIKAGENCIVQLVVKSAWTSLPVTMSFKTQDGQESARVTLKDVLLPRVTPSIETNSLSATPGALYSKGGANSNLEPTCIDARSGWTLVEPIQVIQIPQWAAIANNSCHNEVVMNPTKTRVCVRTWLEGTPVRADYRCDWRVAAVEARVEFNPPRPPQN